MLTFIAVKSSNNPAFDVTDKRNHILAVMLLNRLFIECGVEDLFQHIGPGSFLFLFFLLGQAQCPGGCVI